MTGSIPVTLPGGTWRNGARRRDATLRPLDGRDEMFLAEEAEGLSPARRTTALLARCVERLGGDAVRADDVRALNAGDREALLLHLRRATFGETMASVLHCPHPECGEAMDLELRVGDLLVHDGASAPVHEATIEGHTVRFRLPNGADLEEAATLAAKDVRAAARHVLARCIESIDGAAPASIPKHVAARLPERMSQLDPQAELLLQLTCTKCARPFTAVFDTAAYLFRELGAQRDRLYREIHELAFHYHWSESEILGMTATRRRRYLTLLAEALAPRGKR
ncbi:MAG TPA: hypothetical protein VEO54_16840 [Thermoanaerobaculia bacterium]|nr:hypothetical protein [Thermoanaerobaculia bacterium]